MKLNISAKAGYGPKISAELTYFVGSKEETSKFGRFEWDPISLVVLAKKHENEKKNAEMEDDNFCIFDRPSYLCKKATSTENLGFELDEWSDIGPSPNLLPDTEYSLLLYPMARHLWRDTQVNLLGGMPYAVNNVLDQHMLLNFR